MITKAPQIIILIGIPASGKSTFAATHFSAEYVRISLDVLHKRSKEARELSGAIAKKLDIVVDNTNVSRAERKRFIEPAKAAGYEVIGFYFQSVIEDCLKRNAQRSGKARIPDVGVIARANALELPSRDEGFDKLYYVKIADDGFNVEEWKGEYEQ